MQTRISYAFSAIFAIALASGIAPLRAQVFADAKTSAIDYSKSDLAPKKSCDAMASFKSKDKDIAEIHVMEVAATAQSPAYCKITGTLFPEVAFEVSLPDKWDGRFYMIGNGGLAGESMEDAGRVAQRNQALSMGFAFAQTNTGHDSRKEPSGSFILSNPEKAIDYAYRAVHLTALTAKSITKDYYGKAASKSYWNSCSNGGRQGMLEAQRYPGDFDGIIANSPWVDQTGFTIGAMWNEKALSEAPLTPAKLALLSGKVMEKCDATDGVKDGLIGDPRKCSFDAKVDVPSCKAGADSSDCLTPAQADAIDKIYSGPISNGKPFFTGYMLGSEGLVPAANGTASSGWMNVIVPARPGAKPADFNLAEGIIRYLVPATPNPTYDYKAFDYNRDIHTLDAWSAKADAKDPDLSKFRKTGGKIMMTYGWADPILQPMMGVTYYEQAVAKNGPSTKDFFRLYMVPGMGHCGGGIATDRFDSMTAMVNWVEKGSAPDVLHATRAVNGQVVRSRPVCPYPQEARYSGQGSVDDAANFRCVQP